MPTTIDLRTEGSSVTIGGVIYEDSENVGSGTGGYNTFLALFDQGGAPKDGGNDGEEDGINSDIPNANNPEVDDAKSNTLQLGQLAVVTRTEGDFYQFRVDINESEGGVRTQISLDQFKIYSSASGTIQSLADLVGGGGTLEYDMDAGGDVSLQLIKDSSGGGTDDYSVFIPTSVFDGLLDTTYIYVYVQMGALGGDYKADSGFEEWRALSVGDVPSIEVDKSVASIEDGDDWGGTGQADSAGDVINYEITVENVGNVQVTGVTVIDQVEGYGVTNAVYASGDLDDDDILDIDEIWTFTASYVLQQADLDGQGGGDGFLDNLATGDSLETPDDSDDASVPLVYLPSMEVTKSVDSVEDSDDWGGVDQLDSVGDKVNYTITIANTGNISLTNVVLGDVVEAYDPSTLTLVSDGNGDAVLDVGETWTYSASYTITQADLDGQGGGDGTLDNVATGDTEETEEDSDTASVPLVYLPSVDIEKYVSVDGGLTYTDEDDPTGPAVAENVSTIYFKFVVVNNGNISLSNVTVSDDKFDLDPGAGTSWVIGDLGVGGSDELIITAPFQIGQHANTGTVTTNLPEVTDSDMAHYFGVEGPGVRTPGFWQSKFGSQFWDGKDDNEAKASQDGFADGELIQLVDSDGVGGVDVRGLLVGDYSGDGIENFGEDTLFIDLKSAQLLINASEKDVQDGRFQVGRDLVATWLNYLAGNPVGPDDPDDGLYSAREAINDAVDWLQAYGDPDGDGLGWLSGPKKVDWDGASAVKLNVGGGSAIHNALDEYNNYGTVNGVPYANDADNSLFITVLNFL